MTHSITLLTGLVAATMVLTSSPADARQGVVKARGTNGSATAVAGPNGGKAVRGRGAVQNPDGSVSAASGAAFRAPNGAKGARASTTTVNPDGSATHSGGFTTNGARGDVQSTGSASRDANGNWTGGRNTSATSAATGNSYQGSTSVDSATGQVTHTGTCYDASGNVIACPR